MKANIERLNKRVREIFREADVDVDGLLVFNQEDSVSIDYNIGRKEFFTYSFERGVRHPEESFASYIEAVRSLIRDFVPTSKEQDVLETLINDNRTNAKLYLFRFISSSRYLQRDTEGAVDADYDTEKKMWYLYLFTNAERSILAYYDTFEKLVCAIIEKEINGEKEKRKAIKNISKKVFI